MTEREEKELKAENQVLRNNVKDQVKAYLYIKVKTVTPVAT